MSEPIAPYTGRVAPARGAGPRIRWVRMMLVQLIAGAVVAFAVVLFLFEFRPEAAPLGLIAALVVVIVAALPPFLGARLAHRIAIRMDRSRNRELVAVVTGAIVGSVVPLLVFGIVVPVGIAPDLLLWGIVAVASAIGFAIWVWVAWLPPKRVIPAADAPDDRST